MATAPLPVPELVYLRSTDKPDCHFVDGVLEERSVGEGLHSYLQSLLARLLGNHELEWGILVSTEWRVQVKPGRYRIPDVCVIAEERFERGVLTTPPLLCIEVLSSEDREARVLERLRDFFDMGVESIRVFNPETREGFHASRFGLLPPEDGVLRVNGSSVHLILSDLWAACRVR